MSLDRHMAFNFPEAFYAFAILTLTILVGLTTFFVWSKFVGTPQRKPSRTKHSKSTISLTNGDGIRTNGSTDAYDTIPKIGEIKVSKILIHPIKSCKGISLLESRFTPQGLENDRKWCIVDADSHTIITAREFPKMVLIESCVLYDSSDPFGGRLVVEVPQASGSVSFSVPLNPSPEVLHAWSILNDCNMHKVIYVDGYICQPLSPSDPSPADVLSEYFGRQVLLMMKGPAPRECDPTRSFPDLKATAVFQDGYPLLFASEESLQDVAITIKLAATGDGPIGKVGGMDPDRWKDGNVEIERFRPNIVLKGAGHPWIEDMWRTIVISSESDTDPATADINQTFNLVSKCTRCLLPNVDTKTGVRDAAVPYKVLMKFRTGKDPARMSKPCFGCNGVPLGSGVVRVDNRVFIKEWADGADGI